MKGLKTIIVIIGIVLTLTGCTGKEPNEIAYIVAVGIDKGENENYNITMQYVNPSTSSESKESNDENNSIEHLTFQVPNVYAAIEKAGELNSKTFSLAHTKLIIVSRETSEDGIEDITENFIRNDDLRPDVYLAVADGSAKDYLEKVNPKSEVNMAKYYLMIFDKNKMLGLSESIIKNFFCGLKTADYDSVVPIAHSSDESSVSSAVFKGGKMVGTFTAKETEIYKLLEKNKTEGYLTLKNDTTLKNPVTIKTVQKKNPKYHIDHNKKKIEIDLSLEGDINSLSPDYRIDRGLGDFERNCEECVAGECEALIEKAHNQYKSDILKLNERSKIKFLNNDAYNNFKNHVNYSEYKVKVNVDYDIRRTGLVVKEV